MQLVDGFGQPVENPKGFQKHAAKRQRPNRIFRSRNAALNERDRHAGVWIAQAAKVLN
jgi:hypothetical protein